MTTASNGAARGPAVAGADEPALVPRWRPGASVKLVGLGGVGGIVARYLTLFLRSLDEEARLVLIDGDAFEADNAERMLFGDEGNKARVCRADLLPHVADSRLTLLAVPEYVTAENVGRLLVEGDLVVLTVDNHATRHLVDEHCRDLADVCLVSGGNDGVGTDSTGEATRGTFGNVQVHWREGGVEKSPSLGRYHPEIARPVDRPPGDEHCTDVIARTPQILFANLAAASAILNALWLHLCGALHYGELAFDIHDGLMKPLPWPLQAADGSATAS